MYLQFKCRELQTIHENIFLNKTGGKSPFINNCKKMHDDPTQHQGLFDPLQWAGLVQAQPEQVSSLKPPGEHQEGTSNSLRPLCGAPGDHDF